VVVLSQLRLLLVGLLVTYRIIRVPNRNGSYGRSYLKMENAAFAWLETHDYDCWDDCEALASSFTEFEAAILLLTFSAHDPQRVYDYEAVEAK
jgi:hypothetical protein